MENEKNLDDLILSHWRKASELSAIEQKIEDSKRALAVVFIDLVDSTRIKQELSTVGWLRHIYNFIETVSILGEYAHGIVVKRIGDELLITFESAPDADNFIRLLTETKEITDRFRFKIAADYGFVYHFQFKEGLEKDPYGNVVDRCARIAKYAQADVTLCSRDYADAVKNIDTAKNPTLISTITKATYFLLGKFSMRGFSEPQELFIRETKFIEKPDDYYAPLIESLNKSSHLHSGYRYISRKFSPSFFQSKKYYLARPFLLRELINVPKLHFPLLNFIRHIRAIKRRGELDQYIGMLVEWDMLFGGGAGEITDNDVSFWCYEKETDAHIQLLVHSATKEVLRHLKHDDPIHVRGIIEKLREGCDVNLNYVDLALSDKE